MARTTVARLAPFLAVAIWSLPAEAQDAATAQALFEEARSLMQQQKLDLACPKFAESQRLGPAAGTLLNLGECYAKQGKSASAWAAFKEAIPAAHSAGQKDREDFARERVAEIEPTLVKLAIKVDAPGPQEVVKRDGAELGKAAWGTPIPVDPGPHLVEASAPGKKPWKMTIDMGSDRLKEVVVPALEDAGPVEGPKSKLPIDQRTIGIGVAGLGGVALVIGAIAGLGAISTNSDAEKHCRDGNKCSQEGLDLLDSASSKATTSTIFFVLGVVAVGGGAFLYFTAPQDEAKPKASTRLRLAPSVTPTAGGFALSGSW